MRVNNHEEKLLIDKIGLFHQKKGMSPIESRIMAFFMIREEELFSFDDVVKGMQISKSTASTALRSLVDRNILTHIKLNGSRKRYFKLKAISIEEEAVELKTSMSAFRNILNESLKHRNDQESSKFLMLKKRLNACDFLINKIDDLIVEYKTIFS